ncbi:MAG: glycosyltransferase [Bacteroidales bacterium]|jgi:hypothetical protein|nr:glycosyltransferase [Bacteroidales bacterium]
MDLSVIIVCYRGWEKLSKCLEALESFSITDFSMEVIVVDNNSDDGRVDEFEKKFSRIRFIRSSINGGYAYGCNLGAGHAAGDVLMILNPDTVANEKAVGHMLRKIREHEEPAIVSCSQASEDGKESRAYGRFPSLSPRNLNKAKEEGTVINPDWVSGSLMMMRKETFSRLDGFDEDFWMYYEDVDICRRLRNRNGMILFFKDIGILHCHGGSSRIDLRTESITKAEVQKSRHLYIHKHFTGLDRILFQSIVVADNLVTGIISGLAGLVFFFIPKLLVRLYILIRLTGYYAGSLYRCSWRSTRSVRGK